MADVERVTTEQAGAGADEVIKCIEAQHDVIIAKLENLEARIARIEHQIFGDEEVI